MPIVIEDAPEEFVSLEVKQDLEAGTLEVTQSKYFLAAGKKFAEHLEPLLSKKLPETPFPENEKVVEGTDEELYDERFRGLGCERAGDRAGLR